MLRTACLSSGMSSIHLPASCYELHACYQTCLCHPLACIMLRTACLLSDMSLPPTFLHHATNCMPVIRHVCHPLACIMLRTACLSLGMSSTHLPASCYDLHACHQACLPSTCLNHATNCMPVIRHVSATHLPASCYELHACYQACLCHQLPVSCYKVHACHQAFLCHLLALIITPPLSARLPSTHRSICSLNIRQYLPYFVDDDNDVCGCGANGFCDSETGACECYDGFIEISSQDINKCQPYKNSKLS